MVASLIGIHLSKVDRFKDYQSDEAVYHDDWAIMERMNQQSMEPLV